MASTSTSASLVQKRFKYDVFLSFRGEDTRKTFVDHLYHALDDKGIITYKDDERIEKGKKIDEQLIKSIEDSRFHIIVFSKSYASSSWCLDELVKIMECQKTMEQTTYPVFYDVEPTEVRKQSGAVGEAFAKQAEKEGAERWRDALKEAAGLAGWELKDTVDGHEAKFIQKIVKDISLKPHFMRSCIDGKLVGMETRVKGVISSLELDSNDVRMIGIKGMGGGGKTTLARAVFDHISFWFDAKCFVENVREGSKGSGLKELQKQVLKEVSNDQSLDVTGVLDGKNKMNMMMGSKKVLLVLDDVDDIDQLEALAGELTWFMPGSRIIITTRDKQVLVEHDIHDEYIHDVNLLSHKEATCLFSRYAFKTDIPIQGYEVLSEKVVHYAAGLPLTIKVLGSFLRGKNETEWVDALERLKTIPLEKPLKILEISYDGLENDHKEIFLDVACLLKGIEKDKAITIFESCGLHAEIGLKVLEHKSLINILYGRLLYMHDRIEEMGRDIVRRLHPHEPERHNRLWFKEEIENILVKELGTQATLGIKLMYPGIHPAAIMNGLRKMKKLRFLYVTSIHREDIDEGDTYLPNSLQYLYWEGYTFRCLPKTFEGNKLVNLDMKRSTISQLWEGGEKKVLNNLRFLNLSCSKLRTFDLGLTPHLEKFDARHCFDFVELHMPVECPKLKSVVLKGSKLSKHYMGLTPQLERLDLESCNELVELHLPAVKLRSLVLTSSKLSKLYMGLTPQLETLELKRCNDLVELHMPAECPKLKSLVLTGSKLSKLYMGLTPQLEKLDLGICNDLVELHMPAECPKLKSLVLSGSMLSKLYMGLTPQLETLNLERCNDLVELHLPTVKLKSLVLTGSKLSKLYMGLTPHLETFDLKRCNDLVELHLPAAKLKSLVLTGSKLSKLYLGLTPQLETLDLGRCNDLVELHMPVECPKLKSLVLNGSKVRNLNLGMTPHLEKLDLEECYQLQEIHAPVGCLKKLLYLNLSGCLRFIIFFVDKRQYCFVAKRHESAGLDSIATLELAAEPLDICPVHPNSNLPKFQFKCKYYEPVPSSSGNLAKNFYFGVCACTNYESFLSSICGGLQQLRLLTLDGGIVEMPKDIAQLENLEKLSLLIKEINHIPDKICMLKHLKYLVLKSCWLLENLPKDLDGLESLEVLDLTDCVSLRGIPISICNMKCLLSLKLQYCIQVEKLPEEFGRLENLEDMNIEGAGIRHLPHSIFQLKGLYIVGSTWRLESYGFTSSLRYISRDTACCYIKDLQQKSPL